MDAILRTDHSCFRAALPPMVANQAGAQDKPVVLFVDDEPGVVIILGRLLGRSYPQYEIITAESVREALGQIAGREVALVVTDFNMPDMNGLQLAQAIKMQAPGVKVVLITAYASDVLEHLARQYQVDYYMTKPFRLTRLEAIVEMALAGRTND
jgi:DNA-binding NtrC family response regulator